jgi:MFS family permease
LKNRQALTLLFTANAISGFAQGVSMLAVPWYFAQQAQSSKFNMLYALVTGITMFWGLFAGSIVDRYNRKSVFLGTNLIEGCLVLGVGLLGFYWNGLDWPLVILVFGITILGYHLHYPNLYAFAQEITEEGNYQKVTSLLEIVGQSTNVGAGVLAALLLEGFTIEGFSLPILGEVFWQVDPWPIWKIFLLDGSTYFVSVTLIWFIRYQSVVDKEIETGNVWKRIRSGFAFLKNHRALFNFGITSYAVFVVMLVMLHALMPLYIKQHLGAGGKVFGSMEVLYALGALSAGLFIQKIFRKSHVPRSVMVLMVVAIVALSLAATTRSVTIFLLVGFLIGFSNAGIRVLRLSFLFDHIPNGIIGRANSVFSILNVFMRICFISLFSLAYFGRDGNIVWAFAIMAGFVATSLLALALQQRRLYSLAQRL